LGKEGSQDCACFPRSKQDFSSGIYYQERLLERILQELAHTVMNGRSGGVCWKGNYLHRLS
jgi:hypothetical protein